jgi:hypothetical protein
MILRVMIKHGRGRISPKFLSTAKGHEWTQMKTGRSLPPADNDLPMAGTRRRHDQFGMFGAYRSFAELDEETHAYWPSRTPAQRMEALEDLRVLNYGQEAMNARIPRVFGVPEPRQG